jgi:hypothetical protein
MAEDQPMSDDLPAVPIPINDLAREDLEELAFELWAFKHSQRPMAVARELGLPKSTVYDWRDRHDWPGRMAQRLAAVAPMYDASTVVNLGLARNDIVAQLRAHADPDNELTLTKEQAVIADIILKHAAALLPDGLTGKVRGGAIIGSTTDAALEDRLRTMTDEEIDAWLSRKR